MRSIVARFYAYAVVLGGGLAGVTGVAELRAESESLPSERESVRVVAKGLMAYLDSFASFRCEYEVRRGLAGSLEQAERVGAEYDVASARARWLVRGSDELIEMPIFSDKEVSGTPSSDGIGFLLGSEVLLKNGKLELAFSRRVGTGEIGRVEHARTSRRESEFLTPSDMLGVKRFAQRLFSDSHEQIAVHTDGDHGLLRVIADGGQGLPRLEYVVDPTRGYLVTEVVYGSDRKVVATDVREFSGHRFFPMRVAMIRSSYYSPNAATCKRIADRTKAREVWEMLVKVFDPDTPLKDDDFRTIVSSKTTLRINTATNSGFGLATRDMAESRPVGLADLEELFQLAQVMHEDATRSSKVSEDRDVGELTDVQSSGSVAQDWKWVVSAILCGILATLPVIAARVWRHPQRKR